MSLTASLVAGGAGFAAVAALTGLVRAALVRHGVMDRPNERSSHAGAVPRGGGIAVTGVLLAAWLALWLWDACQDCGALFWVALVGALGLAAVSWLDDLRGGLSALLRLVAQIAAVGAGIASLPGDALVFQGALPPLVDHALAAVLWLWFVNLFNFMDGIDGISGVEGASLGLGAFLLALLGMAPAGLGPLGLALAGVSSGFCSGTGIRPRYSSATWAACPSATWRVGSCWHWHRRARGRRRCCCRPTISQTQRSRSRTASFAAGAYGKPIANTFISGSSRRVGATGARPR